MNVTGNINIASVMYECEDLALKLYFVSCMLAANMASVIWHVPQQQCTHFETLAKRF